MDSRSPWDRARCSVLAEVAPHDVDAQGQRQPGLLRPRLAEVEDLGQPHGGGA